ncbi:MAG: hypothetical protein ACE5I2_07590 [Anaerolineae bacterium]
MRYVVDTVALVRHLRQHRRLEKQARQRLGKAAQHTIYISAITLTARSVGAACPTCGVAI